MRLLRRFAPRNDKMVYRITYNVYRLNTVASRKLFKGGQGEAFPLIILFAKQDSISLKRYCSLFFN